MTSLAPEPHETASEELEAFARFCRALRLESGRRMSLEDFQRTMLGDFFRGTDESLILIPKKNGKSTVLAALALFHLVTTPDAECLLGAASRDQATILYDQAAGFVRRSEGLDKRVVVKRGYREIRSLRDSGRIRVLAADVDTADGVIPTLALVDELHRHKSAGLYGIFRDGLGPREGKMITISTAGDSETSPLGTMRLVAHQLPHIERDGRHLYARSADGGYAMHEWSLDPDEDRDDLDLVKLANPASWQTTEALRKRRDSPSMLDSQWARFACGVWQGGDDWWVRADQWAAQGTAQPLQPGDAITIGFDGSRVGDGTAIVGCRLSDGALDLLGLWENPGDSDWEVPGGEVDAKLAEAYERFRVVRGYFDPPLWRSEIEAWAREYGQPGVTPYRTNGRPMQAAVERFRTDLLTGAIHHSGARDLRRHVLNARTQLVRGGYFITKATPMSPDKIDAAIAAVLAYEARCDAIANGELDPRRTGFAFL
jgi:phage terminase large subunit-like protein